MGDNEPVLVSRSPSYKRETDWPVWAETLRQKPSRSCTCVSAAQVATEASISWHRTFHPIINTTYAVLDTLPVVKTINLLLDTPVSSFYCTRTHRRWSISELRGQTLF